MYDREALLAAIRAKLAELVAYDWISDRGGKLLVQPRDDMLWRPAWCQQREPA